MTAAGSEAEVLDAIPIATAVITSGTEADPAGFTGSVWGEPRNPGWLAVPVSAGSSTLPVIVATGRVGVNVLGERCRPLVGAFAKRVEKSSHRFDGVDWTFHNGVPVLTGGIAWFSCTLDSVVPFGGYQMMMCRIERSEICSKEPPLVWVNGHGIPAGTAATTEVDR
ncbi:flavin reductase family protein [Mycobacterium sp. ITM-2016-00317]|uniref:flavin reductase family protein n=1 Tax=Mycobacterium sp. ITM-2016-00317 TaxID=2099694 RepID=UPI00287FE5E0|nr:flavin reductase family protein [Mycobacterium sp. ITM-2016-00317]WNG85870.1 flavin reductase family protein [Mycobacterium sp. ITM-2016-00317]